MILNFIPPQDIEKKTITFLSQYHRDGSIPIPIEDIIEIKLKIKIIPSLNLLSRFGIDAFSTRDFKEIYIDNNQFFEIENRARFTLAHEIGHFILHHDFIKKSPKFKNIDQWKNFVLEDVKREPLETQANIFAGFLLMPTSDLERAYENAKLDLQERKVFPKKLPDDQILTPYLAKPISKIFKVSEQSCELRIKNWLSSKR